METPGPEDHTEQDRGDQRRDELGELKQPQVHRSELVCEQDGGQRDRGYRTRSGAHRNHDPAHWERAAERANAQQGSLGAILVHDEKYDQREPTSQRHERHGVQERVGEQLRGAVEQGHAARGGQCRPGGGCEWRWGQPAGRPERSAATAAAPPRRCLRRPRTTDATRWPAPGCRPQAAPARLLRRCKR